MQAGLFVPSTTSAHAANKTPEDDNLPEAQGTNAVKVIAVIDLVNITDE